MSHRNEMGPNRGNDSDPHATVVQSNSIIAPMGDPDKFGGDSVVV